MNDIDFARPIKDHEFAEWQAKGPSLLQQKIDLLVRLNRLTLRLCYVLGVSVIALSVTIFALSRLREFIPVFFGFNGDIVESVSDISKLPPNKREDVVKSVLWTVVQNWESYSGTRDIKTRYDIVSALTAGQAQHEYQMWINSDKSAPVNRLGDNGRVDVAEIPKSAVITTDLNACRKEEWCEASLSFTRKEQSFAAVMPIEKHWSVQFRFVFVDQLDVGDKETFNPAAIKITAYHHECDDCGS